MRNLRKHTTGICVCLVTIPSIAMAGYVTITNDTFWRDTNKDTIKCQGGNVFKLGSDYYWVGPDLFTDVDGEYGGTKGINMYKSTDLASWTRQGYVLAPSVNGAPADLSGWAGRPSILYNSTSGKYILFFEYGGGVSAATSSTIAGPYTWVGRIPNSSGLNPEELNDMTVFADGGNGYVVTNDDKSLREAGIWKLRSSDFLAIESRLFAEVGNKEAHNITKIGGTYYWFASQLNAWWSSWTSYRTAQSLSGPWSSFADVQTNPNDAEKWSFNTQVDFIIPVVGSQTTSYIFCGDRYSEFTKEGVGFNAWFPLTLNGSVPVINGYSSWQIDVATGQWRIGGTATQAPVPKATRARAGSSEAAPSEVDIRGRSIGRRAGGAYESLGKRRNISMHHVGGHTGMVAVVPGRSGILQPSLRPNP